MKTVDFLRSENEVIASVQMTSKNGNIIYYVGKSFDIYIGILLLQFGAT